MSKGKREVVAVKAEVLNGQAEACQAEETAVAVKAEAAQLADQQSAEQAAQESERERIQDEADTALKTAAKNIDKGEKSYLDGYLLAGKYAHRFICLQMQLKHSRSKCVEDAKLTLQRRSSHPIDVNRLVQSYFAYHLLVEADNVKATGLTYGHFRDAFASLVLRAQCDTPEESYTLYPGIEDKSKALLREAIVAGWTRSDTQKHVDALLHEWNIDQQAKAKAEAERVASQREAAEAEAEAKAKAEAEAKEEAERAARAAKEEADAQKREEMTRKAEEAKAALLKAQVEKRETEAKAAALAKQEKQIERQVEKHDRAIERAAKKGEKRAKPRLGDGKTDCTPEQAAEMAIEFLFEHEEPETVLFAMLAKLAKHADMSKPAQRALESALVSYNRKAARQEASAAALAS